MYKEEGGYQKRDEMKGEWRRAICRWKNKIDTNKDICRWDTFRKWSYSFSDYLPKHIPVFLDFLKVTPDFQETKQIPFEIGKNIEGFEPNRAWSLVIARLTHSESLRSRFGPVTRLSGLFIGRDLDIGTTIQVTGLVWPRALVVPTCSLWWWPFRVCDLVVHRHRAIFTR